MATECEEIDEMAGMPMSGLTRKQIDFCRFYLEELNGTQAAIRAGYAEKSAHVRASRLLKKDKVQKYLAMLQKPALDRFNVTQERIMEQLHSLAFANIFDFIAVDEYGQAFIDMSGMTEENARGLEAYETVELRPQTHTHNGKKITRRVRQTKIKMRDCWPAMAALLKRYDLLMPGKENGDIHNNIDPEDLIEVARRAAFLLRKAEHEQKIRHEKAVQKN